MIIKQIFDYFFALILLFILSILLLFIYVFTSIDTKSNGLFLQKRVGQHGKLFTIFKFKTMHPKTGKISKLGAFLRKYKIDELPQLFNILIGNMSFVGPRPDIQGYYDTLEGENRKILELKPGLTSDASIKYANEESLLAKQNNPKQFNDEILFPEKVKMNLEYYHNHSFWGDIQIIFKTFLSILK